MKQLWIKADTGIWDNDKKRITTALESGFDFALVNESEIGKVRELGNIKIAAHTTSEYSNADTIVIGKDSEGDGTTPLGETSEDIKAAEKLIRAGKTVAGYVVIHDKDYETFASDLARHSRYIVVIGTDWKVIPLENLIADLQSLNVEIIAGVTDTTEAKLALETLEHGSDGLLVDTDDLSEIKRIADVREKSEMRPIELTSATVTKVKPVGMGDRVCVDTCSLMKLGEGMLIGSQSNGLFLVHAESEESPYVAARPFRVNAGAVHAYVKVGEKTRYLSEMGAGDDVLVIDKDGGQKKAVVGRVKIEKRPLMLVEARVENTIIKTLLQNAETIKLVKPDGTPIPVTQLKEDDKILVQYEETARHFGIEIEETIIEK
ncbi:3-dehydroquinate synthase II [Methanosarcinales archaeon ex4484_138]|nr:MAG: 3-dehydroquinate synthase II [Methanosarcinales archaeon ex4484_138]